MLAIAIAIINVDSVRADSTLPATDSEKTESVEKSRYNLFNPTPRDQMREMETDRPDKTDAPITIDAGHLQIETGVFDYVYYRNHSDAVDVRSESLSLGQFDFRLGLLDNLEFNTMISAVNFQRFTDYTADQSIRQSGFGDTVLGLKVNFWGNEIRDDVWATAFGFIPQVKIPTATDGIGNSHFEFFGGIPFFVNLPASFGLALESIISSERNSLNTGYVAGWQNSASLDRVVFGNLDVYIEYWSHVSGESHQEAQQTVDVGATYPISENVIVDTGVNFGLNHASDNIEWVAGISVRL